MESKTQRIRFYAVFPLEPEDNGIGSFEILDPDTPGVDNTYCLGFRYLGGDSNCSASWDYDHTNLWMAADLFPEGRNYPQLTQDLITILGNKHPWLQAQQISAIPKKDPKIPRKELDSMLSRHGTNVQELLITFISQHNI
jgi:hypothetical protein